MNKILQNQIVPLLTRATTSALHHECDAHNLSAVCRLIEKVKNNHRMPFDNVCRVTQQLPVCRLQPCPQHHLPLLLVTGRTACQSGGPSSPLPAAALPSCTCTVMVSAVWKEKEEKGENEKQKKKKKKRSGKKNLLSLAGQQV